MAHCCNTTGADDSQLCALSSLVVAWACSGNERTLGKILAKSRQNQGHRGHSLASYSTANQLYKLDSTRLLNSLKTVDSIVQLQTTMSAASAGDEQEPTSTAADEAQELCDEARECMARTALLADCTLLSADGTQFKTSRAVLALCSKFFG